MGQSDSCPWATVTPVHGPEWPLSMGHSDPCPWARVTPVHGLEWPLSMGQSDPCLPIIIGYIWQHSMKTTFYLYFHHPSGQKQSKIATIIKAELCIQGRLLQHRGGRVQPGPVRLLLHQLRPPQAPQGGEESLLFQLILKNADIFSRSWSLSTILVGFFLLCTWEMCILMASFFIELARIFIHLLISIYSFLKILFLIFFSLQINTILYH